LKVRIIEFIMDSNQTHLYHQQLFKPVLQRYGNQQTKFLSPKGGGTSMLLHSRKKSIAADYLVSPVVSGHI
jgi:hypothetical protein